MKPTHSIRLGVNIDHVATIRQARGTRYPDPVYAALIAQTAGADSITVHLREDRRHIQPRDIELLQHQLQVPMNLEMAASEDMITFAERLHPTYCCLVPEKRAELTTEGGLDVISQAETLTAAVSRLTHANIIVSLFIDPDEKQINAAKATGTPVIELHTGHYANARNDTAQQQALKTIYAAAEYANSLGLIVNAGHGLHYHNVQAIAAIPVMHELNIGHSIVAEALFDGFANAVRKMKHLMLQHG